MDRGRWLKKEDESVSCHAAHVQSFRVYLHLLRKLCSVMTILVTLFITAIITVTHRQVRYLAALSNLPVPVPEAAAKLADRAAAFRTQICNLELIVNTHNSYQKCARLCISSCHAPSDRETLQILASTSTGFKNMCRSSRRGCCSCKLDCMNLPSITMFCYVLP